LFVLTFIVL